VTKSQAGCLAALVRRPGIDLGNVRDRPIGDPVSNFHRTGPFGAVLVGAPPPATPAPL